MQKSVIGLSVSGGQVVRSVIWILLTFTLDEVWMQMRSLQKVCPAWLSEHFGCFVVGKCQTGTKPGKDNLHFSSMTDFVMKKTAEKAQLSEIAWYSWLWYVACFKLDEETECKCDQWNKVICLYKVLLISFRTLTLFTSLLPWVWFCFLWMLFTAPCWYVTKAYWLCNLWNMLFSTPSHEVCCQECKEDLVKGSERRQSVDCSHVRHTRRMKGTIQE